MDQKLRNTHREFIENCKESKIILEKDKFDLETDRQKHADKTKYLNQYSVSNKKVCKWAV